MLENFNLGSTTSLSRVHQLWRPENLSWSSIFPWRPTVSLPEEHVAQAAHSIATDEHYDVNEDG